MLTYLPITVYGLWITDCICAIWNMNHANVTTTNTAYQLSKQRKHTLIQYTHCYFKSSYVKYISLTNNVHIKDSHEPTWKLKWQTKHIQIHFPSLLALPNSLTNFLPYFSKVKSPKMRSTDLDLWPWKSMAFVRLPKYVRAKFHQAKCSGSWVIKRTEKKSQTETTAHRYRVDSNNRVPFYVTELNQPQDHVTVPSVSQTSVSTAKWTPKQFHLNNQNQPQITPFIHKAASTVEQNQVNKCNYK